MKNFIQLLCVIGIFGLWTSAVAVASEVVLDQSTFQWTATKILGKHTGKIFLKSAVLDVSNQPAGTITGGEFVMDMNSFTVEDLTGDAAKKFLEHMKSADFYEVAKYPTSKLVITAMDEKGRELKGSLTIKDKTNPITIKYERSKNQYKGTMKFDRTKFNMLYGSGNFFKNLGDKVIHDEVVVDFTVTIK